MSGLPIDYVDLARILSVKVLGENPEIPLTVIDLATGEAIESPYNRVDAREDGARVVLFGAFTVAKVLEKLASDLYTDVTQRLPRNTRQRIPPTKVPVPGLPAPTPEPLPAPRPAKGLPTGSPERVIVLKRGEEFEVIRRSPIETQ